MRFHTLQRTRRGRVGPRASPRPSMAVAARKFATFRCPASALTMVLMAAMRHGRDLGAVGGRSASSAPAWGWPAERARTCKVVVVGGLGWVRNVLALVSNLTQGSRSPDRPGAAAPQYNEPPKQLGQHLQSCRFSHRCGVAGPGSLARTARARGTSLAPKPGAADPPRHHRTQKPHGTQTDAHICT